MNNSSEIKIVLVDDHQLFRDGLKNILSQKANMLVIAEAANGRDAVKICTKLKPDVAILDVSMPDMNGLEATTQILKSNPDIKIIGLSMYSSKQFIQGMFTAGAYAYLLKDGDSNEFITAITMVMYNKKYLAKKIDQSFLKTLKDGKNIIASKLSSREKEVLQLIAEGNSSKEIAEKLFLSSKTVDVHRNNIMKKIDLYTIPELTKYAIQKGFTSLDF
jgi:DNA-binding NarL/FixJ family response regulator